MMQKQASMHLELCAVQGWTREEQGFNETGGRGLRNGRERTSEREGEDFEAEEREFETEERDFGTGGRGLRNGRERGSRRGMIAPHSRLRYFRCASTYSVGDIPKWALKAVEK